jgi:hypothetical protein
MKLISICLMAVGLMLSATCAMAAKSITTAPGNSIGAATPPLPLNLGLPPATPDQSTGLSFGRLRPQNPVFPGTSVVPLTPGPAGTALTPQ